ncbi:MAG: hypothetical protein GF368_03145 [Candidatus Aenigmarchaeota archaeon]|nr:hypothetical protein [Candidatus Aenigmarchaeota archaeon]
MSRSYFVDIEDLSLGEKKEFEETLPVMRRIVGPKYAPYCGRALRNYDDIVRATLYLGGQAELAEKIGVTGDHIRSCTCALRRAGLLE